MAVVAAPCHARYCVRVACKHSENTGNFLGEDAPNNNGLVCRRGCKSLPIVRELGVPHLPRGGGLSVRCALG